MKKITSIFDEVKERFFFKNKPFDEYIDLNQEIKEYVKFCELKSKKYVFYNEWEKHIMEYLTAINEAKMLYDFKRYCISREQFSSKGVDMFSAYIILILTYLLNIFFELTNGVFVSFIGVIFSVIMAIYSNKKLAKENCFYKDLIEEINKFEKNN